MDFIDEIKRFSKKVQEIKDHIQTEEATKHSIILPFIQLLGYNVFDPNEVVPEFTADVGTKKGEKVDYAIMVDNQPSILIEAKNITDPLKSHEGQLYRYFSVTPAKFAILTNGLVFKFFSDIQEPNKMDDLPFLEFNLLDIRDAEVTELKKFTKEAYNSEELFSVATTLKYTNSIKSIYDNELKDPSDEFIRFFIRGIYTGKATQNVVDRFKPIVKKALGQYLNELINDKIKVAIENTIAKEQEKQEEVLAEEPERKIITTEDELEAYFIIKTICKQCVDPKRITHKDTLSYFSILLDNNSWKWVCRLYLDGNKKYLVFPKEDKTEDKIAINDIEDLYKYDKELIEVLNRYLN